MTFLTTPEEAQSTATAVSLALAARGMRVAIEKPLSDEAPYRTTLIARDGPLPLLIEAQGRPSYSDEMRELVLWTHASRTYCEVYTAMSDAVEMSMRLSERLRRDGVGILLVTEDGNVVVHRVARNPELMITVDSGLALGPIRAEIREIVDRFNDGDRKAALREMTDIVDRETKVLALKAADKGVIGVPSTKVAAMDWSSTINTLASSNSYQPGIAPLVPQQLKDDLQSFRGARNLVDHPALTHVQDVRRQRQYPERMMMGARLTAELLSLRRRLR